MTVTTTTTTTTTPAAMSGESEREALRLADVADRIIETAGEREKTSVEDIMNAVGRRAFGPLLLVFALIAAAPIIGSIPGASIVTATIMALIALQILLRRRSPWIPGMLRRIDMDSGKVRFAMEKTRPTLTRVDRLVRPRWQFLVGEPWVHLTAVICIVMTGLMYPMALVPYGVMPPLLAIIALSLGLTSHDGLLTAIGWALSIGALAACGWIIAMA